MNHDIASAKITTKGQITLPKTVREYLNVTAGDNVTFIVNGKMITLVKTSDMLEQISKLQDIFKGAAEEAGIKTEEDVQKLVDEVRNGKKK